MPTVAITGQTTFGANTSGTTTQLDNNFLLCLNALNNFNQYTNYLADSGAANAYVVTCPASTTATLASGLPIQFKATNANTTASTLNVNGTGVKNILNPNGTALSAGQIPANSIVNVMYDGTQYLLLGWYPASYVTNSLSGNVALNNTANYFDGPSVAQGTVGTWWATGTVSCVDTAGAATFDAKLWDGTTVIASAEHTSPGINNYISIALSGPISGPAGNIRITVKDKSSTSGFIGFNPTGNSKDSTVSVTRIA